jgi:hypothetical protein
MAKFAPVLAVLTLATYQRFDRPGGVLAPFFVIFLTL